MIGIIKKARHSYIYIIMNLIKFIYILMFVIKIYYKDANLK